MAGADQPPLAYRSPPLSRWHPATLRAAWWTARALRVARHRLRRLGLEARPTPPPALPVGATRGVLAVVRRQPHTCLERSLVLQAWLAAHGEPYDIIIGVANDAGVRAHAWLPFEAGAATSPYVELSRIAGPLR